MTIYELRTYTLHVGKMAEAVKLYTQFGYPALQKGGHDKKLIGYFQADTGMINQLVHLWKFDDDADRRALGRRLCQPGFYGRLRGSFPSVGAVPRGQAADGGPVGTASLGDAACTHASCLAWHTSMTGRQQTTVLTRVGTLGR
jgi:NIPSNAP